MNIQRHPVSRAETIARYCEDQGFYLVAIPAGTKGPRGFDWQKPEKAICTPEAAMEYWTRNPDHNVGLLHAPSGTAAWDVDNVEHTRLICTEMGVFYELLQKNPEKKFFSVGHRQFCPNMKKIHLDSVLRALENPEEEVEMDEAMRQRAVGPLARMLELAK